jgi:hypothetical protein
MRRIRFVYFDTICLLAGDLKMNRGGAAWAAVPKKPAGLPASPANATTGHVRAARCFGNESYRLK